MRINQNSISFLRSVKFSNNKRFPLNCMIVYEELCNFSYNSTMVTRYMPKSLTVWITINWKILKEMGIPDHLSQEATVRSVHGTTDWFQIGKGVCQGCILSPCLFNFYAEYIMRNAGLDKAQAGIKIAGRNINNSYMQMTPPYGRK